MRGVENIVRMRRAGVKPSVVFVELRPMAKWTRYLTETADSWVDIHLTPKDIGGIELADLRCLTGVKHVLVNGDDEQQTERVARACFKAGAKVVEAFFYNPNIDPYSPKALTKALRIAHEGEKTVWQQ